ncbi:MAG: hypothetical protein R3D71_05065 [Rickettsiales bacterium]
MDIEYKKHHEHLDRIEKAKDSSIDGLSNAINSVLQDYGVKSIVALKSQDGEGTGDHFINTVKPIVKGALLKAIDDEHSEVVKNHELFTKHATDLGINKEINGMSKQTQQPTEAALATNLQSPARA